MDPSRFWIRFVLAALATWRMTHLLASEDGPGHLIAGFRRFLANSPAGRLMDCFGCLSFWVALPLTFYVTPSLTVAPIDWVVSWLALCGASFLLERSSPEPLVIERDVNAAGGEIAHGMLWKGASDVERIDTGHGAPDPIEP
jgi:hypothetical protein